MSVGFTIVPMYTLHSLWGKDLSRLGLVQLCSKCCLISLVSQRVHFRGSRIIAIFVALKKYSFNMQVLYRSHHCLGLTCTCCLQSCMVILWFYGNAVSILQCLCKQLYANSCTRLTKWLITWRFSGRLRNAAEYI